MYCFIFSLQKTERHISSIGKKVTFTADLTWKGFLLKKEPYMNETVCLLPSALHAFSLKQIVPTFIRRFTVWTVTVRISQNVHWLCALTLVPYYAHVFSPWSNFYCMAVSLRLHAFVTVEPKAPHGYALNHWCIEIAVAVLFLDTNLNSFSLEVEFLALSYIGILKWL